MKLKVQRNLKKVISVILTAAILTTCALNWGFEKNVSASDQFTVNFIWSMNNENPVYAIAVADSNGHVQLPPNPSRFGYTFKEWVAYDNNGNTTVFNENTVVTSDMNVYPQWAVTVTFDLNYGSTGSIYDTVNTQCESTVQMPSDPTRTDYIFAGWKTADGVEFNNNYHVLQNMTVYAQWTIDKCNVAFDLNDGSANTTYTTVKPLIPTHQAAQHLTLLLTLL